MIRSIFIYGGKDKYYIKIFSLNEMDITLVKDPSVTTEASTINLMNMGFGY